MATVPSPYILYPLFYYSEYLPFGLLALFSLLMTIAAMTLKHDKTQKHLERSEKDSDIDLDDDWFDLYIIVRKYYIIFFKFSVYKNGFQVF